MQTLAISTRAYLLENPCQNWQYGLYDMGIYLLPITCENTWILVDCVTYNGISNLTPLAGDVV